MTNPEQSAARQQRLLDAADKLEIMDLSATYMRGLDRLDGEIQATVFWPDAYLDYGIYEGNAEDFVAYCQNALANHDANQHMLGQIQIELDGDEAWGEVYYQAYHRYADDASDNRDLFIAGRYIDRYERRNEEWRISYRAELVDWVREGPAADAWFEGSDMIIGQRKPDDLLYDRARMRKTT
ncbi:MAG: nuclear transport factor 2 family protein [Pseudomonadaceae bacterium]|nr:nuclear transport factor 2 family protein [Pseudomonadaceae bacterium]